MNIFKKILTVVPKSLAGIFGVAQAIVKFVKELLTLVVDILYPVISNEKFEEIIDFIRININVVDDFLEKIKEYFLAVE